MRETDEEPVPTTDELVAEVHAHREGEEYPDIQQLLENLPVVLRGLCDYVLTGEATVYGVARALAALIDVVENRRDAPPKSAQKMH